MLSTCRRRPDTPQAPSTAVTGASTNCDQMRTQTATCQDATATLSHLHPHRRLEVHDPMSSSELLSLKNQRLHSTSISLVRMQRNSEIASSCTADVQSAAYDTLRPAALHDAQRAAHKVKNRAHELSTRSFVSCRERHGLYLLSLSMTKHVLLQELQDSAKSNEVFSTSFAYEWVCEFHPST